MNIKRLGIVLAVVLILTMLIPAAASAKGPAAGSIIKDSHKVRNKWDLSGTFVAHPGYNWGGLAEGATWTYKIHVKEAIDGEASVGTIHFTTGDIDVVGNVKATKQDYAYWLQYGRNPNLAAVGTANYNDTTYYFMFLFAEEAMWFCLSTTPYDTYWASGDIWHGSDRSFQLHSEIPDGTFTLDYKMIHP